VAREAARIARTSAGVALGPGAALRLALALGPTLLLAGCGAEPATAPQVSIAPSEFAAPFDAALEPIELVSPSDHGAHPTFQNEWWYYTGRLETSNGGRYGYQLTFFRRGLAPEAGARVSRLATNQIYFAHLALTDLSGGEHVSFERFSRGAATLAGADTEPLRVYLEDWSLELLDPSGSVVWLKALETDLELDLRLAASGPLVPQGPGGLNSKGGPPGNASYYFSYPWMDTTGTLRVQDETVDVRGVTWFDHEWGSGFLPPGAVGWDWFGLRLADGRAIMLYRFHGAGSAPSGSGTLVDEAGQPKWLRADEFELAALGNWTSPTTGATYPSGWSIRVAEAGLELEVHPILEDQENRLSIVYWEGAVDVTGSVVGEGYVELTGYQADIRPWFGSSSG
jgi:predicted secreted hydrolase